MSSYFVIGFPHETHETLNETAKMIKGLSQLDNVGIHKLVPFYGTAMFEYCHKNGYIQVDMANIHNEITDVSYSGDSLIKPDSLELSELEDFKNQMYEYVAEGKKTRLRAKGKEVPLEFQRMTDLTWNKAVEKSRKSRDDKMSVRSKASQSMDDLKNLTFFNSYNRTQK